MLSKRKQTEAEGYEAMEKFFQSDDMPTGIYCANDISAIGMLKCLNKFRNRYYMPSIISSDDIQEAQFTRADADNGESAQGGYGKICIIPAAGPAERAGIPVLCEWSWKAELMIRNSCSSVEDSMWSDYCI